MTREVAPTTSVLLVLLLSSLRLCTTEWRPRTFHIDVTLNSSHVRVTVDGRLVEEVRAPVGGGVHVAALHQTRATLLASRTLPTATPAEARVLARHLAALQPGRILVLVLLLDGALYLAPAESYLHEMGWRLVSRVGVGEAWIGVGDGRGVIGEAVVTRQPLDPASPATYSQVVGVLQPSSLTLSVPVPARPARRCGWHSRQEMAEQHTFCDTFDGFPELCRCRRPLTPDSARAAARRLEMREIIPCVIMAGSQPYNVYRVLLQLILMPGGGQTPLFVHMHGHSAATQALVRLFNIPYSQHEAQAGAKLAEVTQLIADMTNSALDVTFTWYPHASKLVFVEDDVILSPDFLWFFQQTAEVLDRDPTVLAVSAHNSYSVPGQGARPHLLLRGSMPPQWGWMSTRRLLEQWVPSHWGDWDYWVLARMRGQGLDVVFPELSRSLHAGSAGTHIDGFAQALFFDAQAAVSALVNLTNVTSVVKEEYSRQLRALVASAVPVTLTSIDQCGPEFLPPNEAGPFVMFCNDPLERLVVKQCLDLFSEDGRCDFEGVLSLRVGGRSLLLVICPDSPHCVHKPSHHVTAVPHDDHLVEASCALEFFRSSKRTRTPFRLRRQPSSLQEEAQLDNTLTGYAAHGMQLSTLFLNKGVVLPLEVTSSSHQSTGTPQEKVTPSSVMTVYTNITEKSDDMTFLQTADTTFSSTDRLTQPWYQHGNGSKQGDDGVDVSAAEDSQNIDGRLGRTIYTYYHSCVLPCDMYDPLLTDYRDLTPHLRGSVARVQSDQAWRYDPAKEFTVPDFFNFPHLFRNSYNLP